MPTENRRVATYLPLHIDEKLTAFKSDRGIKGDSQALLVILSEFFGVSQEVNHQGSSELVHRTELLEMRVESLKSELLNELMSNSVKVISGIEDRLSNLEGRFQDYDSELQSNSLDEVMRRLHLVEEKLSDLTDKKLTLSTGELAKRLGIDSSTLSHWKSTGKKGKSPDELLRATREKDPDGIGWSVDLQTGKFKPERELPSSDSESVLQGSLLNVEPSNQVNPVALEGS